MTIAQLSRNHTLRRVFRGSGLGHVYNAWLRRRPRYRQYRGSQEAPIWRATKSESVSLGFEIFDCDAYDWKLLTGPVYTFLDLGANVGLWTVYLHAHYPTATGVCVEPNKECIDDLRCHLDLNDIGAIVYEAAVGHYGRTTTFYKYPISTVSTANVCASWPKWFTKRQVPIVVPTATLDMIWPWPEKRINVMKVDIEGAEVGLLYNEIHFFHRVDQLYIEWHAEHMSLKEMQLRLATVGLMLHKVLEQHAAGGVAFFNRPNL